MRNGVDNDDEIDEVILIEVERNILVMWIS